MIKIKPFRQTPGYCGPASLKMVLDYYGVFVSEAEIAKAAGTTQNKGTAYLGLVAAAKHFGFNAFFKKNSKLSDLEDLVKKGNPPIIAWFSKDDGHYSVVANMNKKEIFLMDPELDIGKRKMSREDFFRVWFDFPGDFINTPKDLILRLMVVVTPKNKK